MPRATSPGLLPLPGMEDAGLSPIRRQYLDLKRRHPDAILFFRLGDFFETFEDDAILVARVLDIALTSREMGRGERFPMAGVPAQAVEGYLARLIEHGHHVAIAEQVGELPRSGLVRREVVRVITPGTVLEGDLLEGERNNFLAALVEERGEWGLAYVDVSTGEFSATEVRGAGAMEALSSELTRIGPAECLVVDGSDGVEEVLPPGGHLTRRGPELFSAGAARRVLTRWMDTALEALGLDEMPLATRAAGGLLAYVQDARPQAVATLNQPRAYALGGTMLLDRATRHNLDLLDSSSASGASLLSVVDRTSTPMGARVIRAWLGRPLLDPEPINSRLDAVEALVGDTPRRGRLVNRLRGLPDLVRLGVRSGQQILAPRECLALADGLDRLPGLLEVLGEPGAPMLQELRAAVDCVPEALEEIRRTVREDATVFEEGVIRAGVSDELDRHRGLAGDARQWVAQLQTRERERTGVKAVKVAYNKVFGYYLELSTAQCAQPTDYYQRQQTDAATVGEHVERLGWTRKQTLANVERYVTPELKDLESQIERARDEAQRLEREIYTALLEWLAGLSARITRSAHAVAQIDALAGLAEAAVSQGYCRPGVDDSDRIEIIAGRHPVVERMQPAGGFVPNDVELGPKVRTILLTGPNMAGKSTYLRQVACIVLLAQVGSFVPADRARVGVVDRVYTRIGAHDDLAAGRSTFLVEMSEAAAILRAATSRSLVLLDELGRGTSTFDGLALAQAIAEDLADPSRPGGAPKVLMATHYHELTALAERVPGVRNYRVDVLEQGDEVVFLHAVVEGGADRSYGVHVARLAGVPSRVTARAQGLLRAFESQSPGPAPEAAAPCAVCGEIAELDIMAMSPLEALSTLERLQRRCNEPG